jgi:hypothetical protein
MPSHFQFQRISTSTLAVVVVVLTTISSLLWRHRMENVRHAREIEARMTSWQALETQWTALCSDPGGLTPEHASEVLGKPSAAFPYVLGNDLSWDAPSGPRFKTGDKVELGITWTMMYRGYGTNLVTRNKTECYYRYKTAGKQKQQERTK